MPQYQKKYPRQKSMHKRNAARSGRDLIVSCIYENIPTFGDTNKLVKPVLPCDASVNMFNVYVRGSVQKVRSRWRACPRRIVIITSLKNNHMLDEQLDTTGSSCVLQTDRRHFSKGLLPIFSRDFWYTVDGYTHTHFVMTGTTGTHDGNDCRLNIHIEHSR